MIWVAQQIWPWLLLSGAVGAGLTAWLSIGSTKVERWVTVEKASVQEPEAGDPPEDGSVDIAARLMAATRTSLPSEDDEEPGRWDDDTPLPAYPFPPYRGPGADERPWEREELWSRPVRRASRPAGPADEWDLAAESWRTWAEDTANAPAPGPGADERVSLGHDDPLVTGGSFDDAASPAHAAHDELPAEPLGVDVPAEELEEHVPVGIPAGGYGPGSVPALPDGSAPAGYTVKGIDETRTYHTLDSRYYTRVVADVWFNSEGAAAEAGYTRWDRRDAAAELVRGELAELRGDARR